MGVIDGNAGGAEVVACGQARAEAFGFEFSAFVFGMDAGIADIALNVKTGVAGNSSGRQTDCKGKGK